MIRQQDGHDAVEYGHLDLTVRIELMVGARHSVSSVVDEKAYVEVGCLVDDALAPVVGCEVGNNDPRCTSGCRLNLVTDGL